MKCAATKELSKNTQKVVERFMSSMRELKFKEGFGLLAEDGKYVVIGTTEVSRTYKGRKDLFDNLLPVLATFKKAPVLDFKDPIVSGDRAVILASGSGEGPKGSYKQPYYAFVTKVKNDEFTEIIEFLDTQALSKALFGKK